MLASVQKYNALSGVIIRKDLQQLATDLQNDEQNYLSSKLTSLLTNNETVKKFDIDVANQGIETVPASLLGCLECIADPEESFTGLNKAVSADNIYQMVTDKIIKNLETAEKWKKPFNAEAVEGYRLAINFITKKPYRSVNQLILGSDLEYMYGDGSLLENPYYLTFKQIEKLGGKIKKGTTADQAIYYTVLYTYKNIDKNIDYGTYDIKKMNTYLKNKGFSKQDVFYNELPILKYYNVFNGKDITGIDFELATTTIVGYVKKGVSKKNTLIDGADAIIKNFPTPAPKLIIKGKQPLYNRKSDTVEIPNIKHFDYSEAYYTVLFHEHIHATGSKERLDRKKGAKFGDKDYAFEELIAEIGASFLSSNAGILHHTLRNGAAYIKSWHNVLLKILKEDNRFIFKASTQAQKAADFILQPDENGVAKYLKGLEKALKNTKKEEKASVDNEVSAIVNFGDPKTYDNDFDYNTVYQSYSWISFRPEERAKSEIKYWGVELSEQYEALVKESVNFDFDIKSLDAEYERFYNYVKKLKNKYISARGNTFSSAITGGSGFNVRKHAKMSGYYDTAMNNYVDGWNKGINSIRKKIHNVQTIKTGSKEAVFLLEQKIESLEKLRDISKLFNKTLIAKKSTAEERKAFLLESGIAQHYKTSYPTFGKFESDYRYKDAVNGEKLVFAYLSKKILDAKKRIKGEELRTKEIEASQGGYSFDGGTVEYNTEDNRIRLFFDEIPTDEIRTKLKKNGYKWSRKYTAWQRQLTRAAIYATNKLFPEVTPTPKPPKPVETKPTLPPVKFDTNGQTALFGVAQQPVLNYEVVEPNVIAIEPTNTIVPDIPTSEILATPVEVKKVVTKTKSKNPLVRNLTNTKFSAKDIQQYNITGDISEFLGELEIKPKDSLAITIDAEQGAGKTRFVFQLLNEFASSGYKCLFVSLEEHPESKLFNDKVAEYINPSNEHLIDTIGELPNWYKDLAELIPHYDCIFIDSWSKIAEEDRTVDFDKHLRKGFDSKLFVTIFQRTTSGTMRGGTKSAFDGDVILKMEKDADFRNSFVYANKNRYQNKPLDSLKYNIFTKSLVRENEPTPNQQQPTALNYEVVE